MQIPSLPIASSSSQAVARFVPNGLLSHPVGSTWTEVALKSEPSPGPPLDGQDGKDELDDDFDFEDSDDENPNAFKLRDALEEPAYQRFTTDELHKLIHEGEIELNPPYQREVVWTPLKQSSLVESIFKNYYVPPIVFAVQNDEYGEEIRICVDGKQRLTSIQKFMDGQIPYKDSKSRKSFWYTVSESLKKQRPQLPTEAKRLFQSKKLTCMEYRGLTPASEREIFQRVQLGVTLTPAEKLQAISSPWSEWINVLESKHVQVEGGLSFLLDWDIKRGRDFQNIAYFIYCCDGLPTVEQLPTQQKLEKWLCRLDPPIPTFMEEMERVLGALWKIASDPHLNNGLKNGKRLAPVEFIFIGVMLYVLRRRSLEDRAHGISYLRNSVRSEFRDIRTNTDVSKYLWDLVRKLEKGHIPSVLNHTNGEGRKRRKQSVGNDDGDYRPSPIPNFGKLLKTRSKRSKS